ncbi:hypothetical protein BofuT4_uP105070.1 [Botrytis cinerea T4]|uniref:Uncharacterized protein n=1 Tax=Botryotinia fuckeliana (strain T4) TaxID=999810 RepID=G2YAC3_BOTF4|nr:hypothetical protein BofuT4_uP105070.1 [Botrytis cinerea T4]
MLRCKAAPIVTFLLPLLQHPHITPSALFPTTFPPPVFSLSRIRYIKCCCQLVEKGGLKAKNLKNSHNNMIV